MVKYMVDEKKDKDKKGKDKSDDKFEDDDEKEDAKDREKAKELAIRRSYPFPLFQQMDRIFDDLSRDLDRFLWRPFGGRVFDLDPFKRMERSLEFRTPLANVSEDDNSYTITAEMPGLDKDDIEITVHGGELEIKGEKKIEHDEKKGKFVRKEYSSSSYSRIFKLPENVDSDAEVDASLEKGVLKITIQKREQEKKEKKRIEIK